MKKIIFASLFIFSFFTLACGQADRNEIQAISKQGDYVPCAITKISKNFSRTDSNKIVRYKAKLLGEGESNIEFEWQVKGANIINGQGTSEILIKIPIDVNFDSTQVKLTMFGFHANCQSIYVGKIGSDLTPPKPRLFDEFGKIKSNEVERKVDNLFLTVKKNSDITAYILLSDITQKQIDEREKVFRKYFKSKGYDLTRIIFVTDGESKKTRTSFWLVPQGADVTIID